MGGGKARKRAPWPVLQAREDTDIRAYTASIIKDLETLKQHHKKSKSSMPREISEVLVDTLLDFSRRVQKAPNPETLAQHLIRMESYMEKTQRKCLRPPARF
ncbi:hypothetical protein BGW36DRAFT_296716 [Talaromyces proteolyticus]|uniref:Uncharacterized protein n=1 Tax=Talaromyces proteolyticus TaxID=1131652 RepID=A0AAD4KPX0_9EURO|nr:uncharacterized protein BGW36DRAFT_296716 [Talaromyces proteolyticus]KAH8696378.1 hypothetical protein BGW36DRAFT_296716 [Talaromyces proteolyticus]